jgi:hypothetical protein
MVTITERIGDFELSVAGATVAEAMCAYKAHQAATAKPCPSCEPENYRNAPKSKGEEIADWWDRGVPNGELSKAIDKAIAEEREACAKVAEGYLGHFPITTGISRDIRSRKP